MRFKLQFLDSIISLFKYIKDIKIKNKSAKSIFLEKLNPNNHMF